MSSPQIFRKLLLAAGLCLCLGALCAPGQEAGSADKKRVESAAKTELKELEPSGRVGQYLLSSYASVDALLEALPPQAAESPAFAVRLRALFAGYPNQVAGLVLEPSQSLLVLLADHSTHIYDDGRTKTAAQRLESPDLKDMFHDLYPLANPIDTLPLDFDPGRVRPESFFKSIYGNSPAEVSRALVNVDFCGKKVLFTSRNGAAEALKKVAADLTEIFKAHTELIVWSQKLGGTYNWRPIAGTDRLSMHSYGAAIDLNADRADYWRWKDPAVLPSYSRKSFPVLIIEAFERHGFIWGGKWSHFDTMHFEYRPEILFVSNALAASLSDRSSPGAPARAETKPPSSRAADN